MDTIITKLTVPMERSVVALIMAVGLTNGQLVAATINITERGKTAVLFNTIRES